ncbi:MAG: toprim domain-containing protein [Patescibacteria group bacterium]
MSSIENLATLFTKFPGIGTRQAKRFVYFLLAQNPRFVESLIHEIEELKSSIMRCDSCYRFFPRRNDNSTCDICGGEADPSILLVVEKDTDFENIHRGGSWKGRYFILGGVVPVLESDPASRIRIKELILRIEHGASEGLSEVVLALSANPEGDVTREYIIKILGSKATELGITITTLGRGLSTGSELEYSDADTLKHALKNRG